MGHRRASGLLPLDQAPDICASPVQWRSCWFQMLALNQVTRTSLVLCWVSVSHSTGWGAGIRISIFHVFPGSDSAATAAASWQHWNAYTGGRGPVQVPVLAPGVGPLFRALFPVCTARIKLGRPWRSVHMPGTHQALAGHRCPEDCSFVLVASISWDSMRKQVSFLH